MARSFRSAASRCASADFTPFPLSAFRAMAEVVEEADSVGGAGGDGGGALLSFGFGKTRERRRFPRLKQQLANGRTAPVSSAYKEGGGGHSAFPNKETPHDLSHDAAFNA